MVTTEQQEFIRRLNNVFCEAQQALNELPLSIPGPLRDQFFAMIVTDLMEEPHRSGHCPKCMEYAHSMALSALGWQDLAAPRPATPQERMDALQEQIRIALRFLDSLEKEQEDEEYRPMH